jgi:ribosomal protein S17E
MSRVGPQRLKKKKDETEKHDPLITTTFSENIFVVENVLHVSAVHQAPSGIVTPSRAEVKERVELYLYFPSGPSWPVIG